MTGDSHLAPTPRSTQAASLKLTSQLSNAQWKAVPLPQSHPSQLSACSVAPNNLQGFLPVPCTPLTSRTNLPKQDLGVTAHPPALWLALSARGRMKSVRWPTALLWLITFTDISPLVTNDVHVLCRNDDSYVISSQIPNIASHLLVPCSVFLRHSPAQDNKYQSK